MKKTAVFLMILVLVLASCKNEVIKKPDLLIEKDVMVNILYDLSLLEAIKYQNSTVLDSNSINSKQYIYSKYKIDSLQFAQNNVYYASNYDEYKKMFEQIGSRLDKNKAITEILIKAKKNKSK